MDDKKDDDQKNIIKTRNQKLLDPDPEIMAPEQSKKANAKSNKTINKTNRFGETMLHSACIKLEFDRVKSLIEDGALVNVCDVNGMTPIQEVVQRGNLPLVKLLLDSDANPNIPGGYENLTPLHNAALTGNLEIYNLLLEKGADPHLKDKKGQTPTQLGNAYLGIEEIKNYDLTENEFLSNDFSNAMSYEDNDKKQKAFSGEYSNDIDDFFEDISINDLIKVSRDLINDNISTIDSAGLENIDYPESFDISPFDSIKSNESTEPANSLVLTQSLNVNSNESAEVEESEISNQVSKIDEECSSRLKEKDDTNSASIINNASPYPISIEMNNFRENNFEVENHDSIAVTTSLNINKVMSRKIKVPKKIEKTSQSTYCQDKRRAKTARELLHNKMVNVDRIEKLAWRMARQAGQNRYSGIVYDEKQLVTKPRSKTRRPFGNLVVKKECITFGGIKKDQSLINDIFQMKFDIKLEPIRIDDLVGFNEKLKTKATIAHPTDVLSDIKLENDIPPYAAYDSENMTQNNSSKHNAVANESKRNEEIDIANGAVGETKTNFPERRSIVQIETTYRSKIVQANVLEADSRNDKNETNTGSNESGHGSNQETMPMIPCVVEEEYKEKKIQRNINKKNKHGETQFHQACMTSKSIHEISNLITEGAEVNTTDNEGWTPLHAAAENGNLDIIKVLLEAGANPNAYSVEDSCTPLHSAAYEGHKELVAFLIHKGGDKDATDVKGKTAREILAELDNSNLLASKEKVNDISTGTVSNTTNVAQKVMLPKGWKRVYRPKANGKFEISLYHPSGKKFQTIGDLKVYIHENPDCSISSDELKILISAFSRNENDPTLDFKFNLSNGNNVKHSVQIDYENSHQDSIHRKNVKEEKTKNSLSTSNPDLVLNKDKTRHGSSAKPRDTNGITKVNKKSKNSISVSKLPPELLVTSISKLNSKNEAKIAMPMVKRAEISKQKQGIISRKDTELSDDKSKFSKSKIIVKAIKCIHDKNGSNEDSIKRYIENNYNDKITEKISINKELKKMVKKGKLFERHKGYYSIVVSPSTELPKSYNYREIKPEKNDELVKSICNKIDQIEIENVKGTQSEKLDETGNDDNFTKSPIMNMFKINSILKNLESNDIILQILDKFEGKVKEKLVDVITDLEKEVAKSFECIINSIKSKEYELENWIKKDLNAVKTSVIETLSFGHGSNSINIVDILQVGTKTNQQLDKVINNIFNNNEPISKYRDRAKTWVMKSGNPNHQLTTQEGSRHSLSVDVKPKLRMYPNNDRILEKCLSLDKNYDSGQTRGHRIKGETHNNDAKIYTKWNYGNAKETTEDCSKTGIKHESKSHIIDSQSIEQTKLSSSLEHFENAVKVLTNCIGETSDQKGLETETQRSENNINNDNANKDNGMGIISPIEHNTNDQSIKTSNFSTTSSICDNIVKEEYSYLNAVQKETENIINRADSNDSKTSSTTLKADTSTPSISSKLISDNDCAIKTFHDIYDKNTSKTEIGNAHAISDGHCKQEKKRARRMESSTEDSGIQSDFDASPIGSLKCKAAKLEVEEQSKGNSTSLEKRKKDVKKGFKYGDIVWSFWAQRWYAAKIYNPEKVPAKQKRQLTHLYPKRNAFDYHILKFFIDGTFSKVHKSKIEKLGKESVDIKRSKRDPKSYQAALEALRRKVQISKSASLNNVKLSDSCKV